MTLIHRLAKVLIKLLKHYGFKIWLTSYYLKNRVIKRLQELGGNSSVKNEHELCKALREDVSKLPPCAYNQSDADREWARNAARLRNLMLKEDPRRFLRWDIIQRTMFVGNADYIAKELEFLEGNMYWHSRYKAAIKENTVGCPEMYCEYRQSSGNLIHHAYSLSQFEDKARVTVDHLELVLEFGGGYGSMCRLFHNLGFSGKYIIFDLPEFSALQRYYLGSLGLNVLKPNKAIAIDSGISCISDLSRLGELIRPTGRNLFLATWSISETSIAFRNEFLKNIPNIDNYLIAYQKVFNEVDNEAFFDSHAKSKQEFEWHKWEIPHLKGNFYLVGSRVDQIRGS